MATSRLGPLSRMTSLQVYCSTVRSLLSCAHAAPAQPNPASKAAATTAPLCVLMSSPLNSTAGAAAQQTDAPRAVSPKRDGAEGRRVTILADQNVAPDALDWRERRARPRNALRAHIRGAVGAVDHRVARLRHRGRAQREQPDCYTCNSRHDKLRAPATKALCESFQAGFQGNGIVDKSQ